jgi:hypothetical protein
MRKLLGVAAAALVLTGLAPLTSARADGPSDETSFVTQINALRVTKGLAALGNDTGLTGKARAWAQTMADQNTIWHSVLSDGVASDWQKLGENVGMGGSVGSLEIAFVNSPHHYENLVDPQFTTIGVGVVRGASGVLFVAEEFMQLETPVVKALVVRTPAPVPAVQVAAVPVPAPQVQAVTRDVLRTMVEPRPAVPLGTWVREF